MNEPVSDMVRSILDGHIVLSRKLAARHHYPSVDILKSVSRVMPDVISSGHYRAAAQIKEWLATYEDAEDLISIGAYAAGTRPVVDNAIERMPHITDFLKQSVDDVCSFTTTENRITELTAK
jgi:flagellum-specific ATP synthase